MTTVIDALVVTLGLDSSKFVKGQKEVGVSFETLKRHADNYTSTVVKGQKEVEVALKKTSESAAAHGKDIEGSMKASSEGVSKLTKEFLGLFAVFTAGKGVKEFISDVTKNDATLGRFANNLRMSTKDLQSWQGAVESVGGAASDVTSSVQGLSDSFQALKIFGDPGIVKALAIIGTRGGKRIDINKPINQTLLDLSSDLSKIAEKDPAQAAYLGRQIGLTQGLYNVIVKGPAVVQKMLDAQAKYAASTADIDAAEKRQSAWQRLQAAGESFGRTVLTSITPALMKLNELLRQFVEWAKSQLPAVQKAFTDTFGSFDEILANIEKTLGKPNWKEWFETIKGWGKSIDSVAKGLGGWKNTLELLLAIAVMNWLSPIVTAFGLLSGSILSIVGAGPALAALFAVGGPLAALAGLYGLVRPTPANEGEDELARQRKYGQGGAGDVGGSAAQNGSPWNHQVSPGTGGGSGGGSPAETTKPYGDKMPSFDEFQKSLAASGTGPASGRWIGQSSSGRGWRLSNGYVFTPQQVYDEYRRQGATDAEARASAGVASQEGTTGHGTLFTGNYGNNPSERGGILNPHGAYGIHQWGGARQADLARYAREHNLHPYDLAAQVGLWREEGRRRGVDMSSTRDQVNRLEVPRADLRAAEAARAARVARGLRNTTPGRASGGPVDAGQGYIVGERGPEYFVPGMSGEIFPHGVNFGNIRSKGQGGFRKYPDEYSAAHAIVNVAKSFSQRFNTDTIAGILKHYSPPNENPTAKLIKNMLGRTGLGSGHLDFSNRETAAKFAYGIAVQEGKAREGTLAHFLDLFSRESAIHHLRKTFGHPHIIPPGLGASTGLGRQSSSTTHNSSSSHEVHVGAVNVHTAATDASGIVRDIKPALERASFASLGNYSLA